MKSYTLKAVSTAASRPPALRRARRWLLFLLLAFLAFGTPAFATAFREYCQRPVQELSGSKAPRLAQAARPEPQPVAQAPAPHSGSPALPP